MKFSPASIKTSIEPKLEISLSREEKIARFALLLESPERELEKSVSREEKAHASSNSVEWKGKLESVE